MNCLRELPSTRTGAFRHRSRIGPWRWPRWRHGLRLQGRGACRRRRGAGRHSHRHAACHANRTDWRWRDSKIGPFRHGHRPDAVHDARGLRRSGSRPISTASRPSPEPMRPAGRNGSAGACARPKAFPCPMASMPSCRPRVKAGVSFPPIRHGALSSVSGRLALTAAYSTSWRRMKENRTAGILWMLATMFCFIALDAIMKHLMEDLFAGAGHLGAVLLRHHHRDRSPAGRGIGAARGQPPPEAAAAALGAADVDDGHVQRRHPHHAAGHRHDHHVPEPHSGHPAVHSHAGREGGLEALDWHCCWASRAP